MRRPRYLWALCALAFLAAACGGPQGSRGVSVEDISTDVGLGVEVNLDAAPANIIVRRPVAPDQVDLPPLPTLPPLETAQPISRNCPRAGPNDFAALDAGVDPDPKVRPAEGTFPWKLDGKIITQGGNEQKVDEFESRRIKDVEDDSAGVDAFHFTTTQSRFVDERPGTGTLETTYRVVPTGNARSVPNPPAGPTVADTGRGLYLVSTIFRGTNDDGEPTESRFEPSNPLLLLGFPVKEGSEINSSGTDPQTGMQITIAGFLKGKRQIDTCGDRVDSWFVDADQTVRITDPDTLQTETFEANYDYSVAPQYGSQLIYERTEAPKDGPIVTIGARIGRIPSRTGAGQ